MSDLDIFNQIVQQTQRQDSLTEQLADLISVATLLGMYDAADWITNQIARPMTKSGKILTDADIQALADEAEQGYDVSHLIERKQT